MYKSITWLNPLQYTYVYQYFLPLSADSSSKTRRPTNVIRPHSNLPRVDEEPTTSEQTREVETVDRGVGPTPLPPPVDPRLHQQSPYYGVQPLLDPRNGLLDYPYGKVITGQVVGVYVFLNQAYRNNKIIDNFVWFSDFPLLLNGENKH